MKNRIIVKSEVEFDKWFKNNFKKLGYNNIIKKNKNKFPDYIMQKGNKELRVELELRLSNFMLHKHSIKGVDEVLCINKDSKLPVKTIEIKELTYEPDKVKRVSIILDDYQLELLKSLKGFGKKEAEKVKNILLAYLSEKGYLEDFQSDR